MKSSTFDPDFYRTNFTFQNLYMDKSFPLSGFGSAALHAGHQQDPLYAHVTPIYASSTFVYDEAEQGMRRFSGEEDGYTIAAGAIRLLLKQKIKLPL